MRFAVCLLVLLATLLDGVEGRARFRLTFFKAGLPSSPDCAPLAEAELVYADDGVCRLSIFNANVSSIVSPTTRIGFDAVIWTYSDATCTTQTSERFIQFSQCMHNGGRDTVDGRSFQVNVVAGGSALVASLALLLLTLL